MDYSTTINETEDPAASPWGSSPMHSPQASRSGAGVTAGEPPSSPFRSLNSQTSNGFGQTQEVDGLRRPDTATTSSGTETGTEAGTEAGTDTEGSQVPGSPLAGDSQSATEPVAGTLSAPRTEPVSAQSIPQQPQEQQRPAKPAGPQYRLQAKITGLERTGKKDPILRLDIHVRPLLI